MIPILLTDPLRIVTHTDPYLATSVMLVIKGPFVEPAACSEASCVVGSVRVHTSAADHTGCRLGRQVSLTNLNRGG